MHILLTVSGARKRLSVTPAKAAERRGSRAVGVDVTKRVLVPLMVIALLCLLVYHGCAQPMGVSDSDYLFLIHRNGNWGYIDRTGRIVIQPIYDMADDFYEGLAGVRIGPKWGYIDMAGKIIIQPQFGGAFGFSDGLAQVAIGGKWGFIDKSGKIVIKPRFDLLGVGSFTEGLAPVRIDDLWGFIDKSGEIAIKPQYLNVGHFREGVAWVSGGNAEGNFCYIDRAGRVAITIDSVSGADISLTYDFYEGMARVSVYPPFAMTGYIDKTGKMVIEPLYDAQGSQDFSEGLAAVVVGGKWGYINTKGETSIKQQFDGAQSFSEGLAPVKMGDQWGFIDREGRFKIPPRFTNAEPFQNGLAKVWIGNRDSDNDYCYVDRTGKFVWKSPDTDVGP